MSTNILSRTRNHDWSLNRLHMQKHSTHYRLTSILDRSCILAYVRLAYNTGDALFLTDIREDIKYEIAAIRTSSIREVGVYDGDDEVVEVTADRISNTLSLCDMLIGEVNSSFDGNIEECISNKFYVAIAEYYNMLHRKAEGEETIKTIDHVVPAMLTREGLSIRVSWPNSNRVLGLVTLDSTKYNNERPTPNVIDFISCVSLIGCDSDAYMSWLANMCIEPDSCMTRNLDIVGALKFAKRWFSPMTIDRSIHTLARGCSIATSTKMAPHMNMIVYFLVSLHARQGIGLGVSTNMVLRAALGARSHIDKHITHVIELLTSKDVSRGTDDSDAEIDTEALAAFKASDIYAPELDVTSKAYVPVTPPKDVIAAEDTEPTEEEPPPEKEKEVVDEEDPDAGEPTEPVEGEEDPVEPVPTSVSKTNDKTGITVSVQESDSTLDEYLFRREIGFAITKLLDNPPETMAAEKLAILKDIRSKWLYIFDVKTIHATVSKIVDLKIKVKTEKVA